MFDANGFDGSVMVDLHYVILVLALFSLYVTRLQKKDLIMYLRHACNNTIIPSQTMTPYGIWVFCHYHQSWQPRVRVCPTESWLVLGGVFVAFLSRSELHFHAALPWVAKHMRVDQAC